MSRNTEMQATENSNKWIDWIEESITKKRIKYYEYEEFNNIQELGSEGFGKTLRVNWKKSDQYLLLKSFKNFDNLVAKELVHELKLRRDIMFYDNLARFYGITTKENENDKTKEYLLVTEYADSGNLQDYLKNNFNRLTWDHKYELAYQLACAVSYLHDEEIMHHDLHSKSILVHQNIIKLADFGLTKRIEEVSKDPFKLFNVPNIPYIDPKRLINRKYKLNDKSDVYSVGVLLWEISSGRSPFNNGRKAYDIGLIYQISQGARENAIPGTPDSYVKIYTECWNQEPDNRPTMLEVVDQLKSAKNAKNARSDQTNKLVRKPNAECSSDDINRIITNGVADCINIKNDIVKPISTMVHGIINEMANKNQEREFDDVTHRDISDDYNRNNNVEPDYLGNRYDSNSPNSDDLFERFNEFGKKAEDLINEVGDAVEKQDPQKIMELLKKSAEEAVTGVLQNSNHDDEEMIEIVDSFKKTTQRTAEAMHDDPCRIN